MRHIQKFNTLAYPFYFSVFLIPRHCIQVLYFRAKCGVFIAHVACGNLKGNAPERLV